MAFSSQAFTAPSLKAKPKLGKTTVSSSIFRGASPLTGTSTTIKIPKGMQIGARASYVDPKYLKKESAPIEQTLVETNNILVEIQKQLSLDFAYRIAKEEDEVKKIRSATDKRKRGKAEEGAETVNKLGSKIGKTVDKIIAPTKNIFDRILQFFGALVGGFLINQGLKWLSKPGSIEKIQGFFDFLSKNANTILMVIGGVLVLRVVRKITRLYRLLRGIARFATGRGFGGGSGGGSSGGLFRNASGGRRGVTIGRETRSFYTGTGGRTGPVKFDGGGARQKIDLDVVTRSKNPLAKGLQRADVGLKKLGSGMMKSMGMGPGAKGLGKLLRPLVKRIPFFGALIDFGLSLALGEPIGRAAAKSIGAMLGGALGSFIPIPGVGTLLGSVIGDLLGGTVYDMLTGGGEDKEEGSGLEFNRGGTVPGPNVNRDIVPLLATPGEKVVPREGSEKFGPFIDDVIYNGGQLYTMMIDALKKQEENNETFKVANEKFETTLTEYEDFVKKIKLKEDDPDLYQRIYGGGDVRSMPKLKVGNLMGSTQSGIEMNSAGVVGQISVNLKQPRRTPKDLKRPSSGSSLAVLPPINMGGGNQTMLPSGTMTKAPASGTSMPMVDAEDPSNFYVAYAMMELGIYGG